MRIENVMTDFFSFFASARNNLIVSCTVELLVLVNNFNVSSLSTDLIVLSPHNYAKPRTATRLFLYKAAGLMRPEHRVDPTFFGEFGMRSVFDNPAFIEHDNPIQLCDR